MYTNPYFGNFNQQQSIERVNEQIKQLEAIRNQMQQPMQTPTNLTQNFQLAPTNRDVIKYAGSIEEVQRDVVVGDTPYFSRDLSVVWIKNSKGEIKVYELNEIVPKDEKDLKIELLQSQIEQLKKERINNAKSNDDDVDESVESKKSTNVSDGRTSKKKSE